MKRLLAWVRGEHFYDAVNDQAGWRRDGGVVEVPVYRIEGDARA